MRRLVDMLCEVTGGGLLAYGTSEGVKKAWESRSHGKLKQQSAGRDREYGNHYFELVDKKGKVRFTVHSLRYPGSRGYHVFDGSGNRLSPDFGFDNMNQVRQAVANR